MRTVVVFSGAGLSAESGIPTFRDSDGLWENHKVEDVASPEGWAKDREMVLRFYEQRFIGVAKAEPNDAHLAFKYLEAGYKVIHITQNIDNLLERAGCTDVRHLHGVISHRKCEFHHNISNLEGDNCFPCDYEADQTEPVKLGDLCPKCGGQLRPDVVWFGEAVDLKYDVLADLVKEVKYNNGVFICVGTSAQVAPASLLIPFFSQVKNKFIVNMKTWKVSDYELREGPASIQVPILVGQLLESLNGPQEVVKGREERWAEAIDRVENPKG